MTEQEIQSVISRFIADAFRIKKWCKKHKCEDCILHHNYPICTVSSIFGTSPNVWESEPEVTDDDKAILRNIPKEYKWIGCDKGGEIWVYESKPSKGECAWHSGGKAGMLLNKNVLPSLFQWCTWEDEEPWYIPDLLG